jgi:hypothetical protein
MIYIIYVLAFSDCISYLLFRLRPKYNGKSFRHQKKLTHSNHTPCTLCDFLLGLELFGPFFGA